MKPTDVAQSLDELIAALDRRRPRDDHSGEAGIARDAAALREEAVNRLASIADETTPAGNGPPRNKG